MATFGDPRLPERFWSKVEACPMTGCWLWTAGQKTSGGYGGFWWHGRMDFAHRVAFANLVGAVPEGMELDHLCRMPACCNPTHLEPVTHRTNIQRGVRSVHDRRTGFCRNGHPIVGPADLYFWTTKTGESRKRCRRCDRERSQRHARPHREG